LNADAQFQWIKQLSFVKKKMSVDKRGDFVMEIIEHSVYNSKWESPDNKQSKT
jgi:hypothetical protein